MKFTKPPTSFQDIGDMINALADHMDQRFNALENRMDRAERRADQSDERFAKFEQEMARHNHRITDLEAEKIIANWRLNNLEIQSKQS